MEIEPRAQQVAQQIVTVVNITRAALVHAEKSERRFLLMDLATNEGIQIYPLEEKDITHSVPDREILQRVLRHILDRLGPDTTIAWEVNNIPGLWVSFPIGDDQYWIVIERDRAERIPGIEWLGWGTAALLLSLIGAAMIVSFVNRPLSRLSRATLALSRGETPAPLPETGPEELRRVNANFNRMVSELARAESDRSLMLAGISHDLRTPLARLRLEIELSGVSDDAKQAIDGDLDQISRTIGQFMEYAKPTSDSASIVDISAPLREFLEREKTHTEALGGQVNFTIQPGLWTLVAISDLERSVSNLIENARRYGHTAGQEADISVDAYSRSGRVFIDISDRGPGIDPADASRMMRPFIRGSEARTDAGGAGLGLAIVNRLIQRNDGSLSLVPRSGGGLTCRITLPFKSSRAAANKPADKTAGKQ